MGYVIEGEIEIDFNGENINYRPGDAVFILPGEAHKHKLKVVSDKAMLFLVEDV
ncbi:MAG: cupin domain-containing protein [Bacteroidetes bacterium]|nr:cupin domain-containing protein [Bacteroidota bacterium]